jgi:two-component system nitrate/nitrite sensor histidine kinase NarX
LQALVGDFEANFEIPTRIHDFPERLEFPVQTQLQLSRIIQESLSNIRKHAKAKGVQISYLSSSNHTTIEIKDDGVGFNPQEVLNSSKHGLQSMQERAGIIKANLNILSVPENGTTIQIQLPH